MIAVDLGEPDRPLRSVGCDNVGDRLLDASGSTAGGSLGVTGDGGRRFDLISELVDAPDTSPGAMLRRACILGPSWCGLSGMAVSLLDGHGPSLVLCSSGSLADALEDLASSLGEGPGPQACADGGPVLVGDLSSSTRWMQYSGAAVRAGAGAVFAFALQIGAARFGAMTLHRRRPGDLGPGELRDAVLLSEIVTSLVLARQADGDSWSPRDLDDLDAGWLVIHQATGMVSAQVGIGVDAGLARMRAHAYAVGRSLGDVAADIVARRLRLDGDEP